jgi:hypothetical protein
MIEMKRSSFFLGLVVAAAGDSHAAILTADVAVYSAAGQYIPLEVGTVWNNWFQ